MLLLLLRIAAVVLIIPSSRRVLISTGGLVIVRLLLLTRRLTHAPIRTQLIRLLLRSSTRRIYISRVSDWHFIRGRLIGRLLLLLGLLRWRK